MEAQYDFFKTPQPKDPGKERYHARLVVKSKMTTDQIARRIADRCSLSASDVKAALIELSDVLETEIRNGNSVHLEGIGTFRGSAKSPSVSSVSEIRAESIHFGGIVYLPDKRLERLLQTMSFKRVEHTHRSEALSEEEIDAFLTAYFQDHDAITTRQLSILCGLRPATALRRLQKRIEDGRLKHPGYQRAPFYFPAVGCYGVAGESSGAKTAHDPSATVK